jgi:sulfide dehydrogenase [flavocytochrome c] flavoprotein subunit
VVVIGGGFGGATDAKHGRAMDPGVEVTLVEPSRAFHTCAFSNYVLAGFKTIDDIAHGDATVCDKHGISVVHDTVLATDPAAKTVRLAGGETLAYVRPIVAPGIDIRFGAIEGCDEAAAERMPDAWKAGYAEGWYRSMSAETWDE